MNRRRALVVTTPAAAAARTSGATLRANEVVELLAATGYDVRRTTPSGLSKVSQDVDLAVAVSYSCAGAVPQLRARAPRLWLDAVDSWLLVDGSGVARGRVSYALRAGRDAWRLARMGSADLVTYISAADLRHDRGTIRAGRRLVLPGRASVPTAATTTTGRRVVVAGDWSYPPNRIGLQWFARRVLPELEHLAPGGWWHVDVYGDAPPVDQSDRLRQLGYAEQPSALYRLGDVHAAPVPFGGGVKRKVLSPLLAGLPVVTTRSGAHGLRRHLLLDVEQRAPAFAAALASRLESLPVVAPVPASDILDQDDSAAVSAWLRQ